MGAEAWDRPVLIATPLGADSDPFVEAARALATALHRLAMVVHAESPPPILLGSPGGGFVPDAALLDRQRLELAAALRDQVERTGAAAVESLVRLGPADLVLASIADERDAELIVLGPPRHPELGTTADRLLCRTQRPVLVVRRPDRLPPSRVLVAVDLSPPAEKALAEAIRLLSALPGGPPAVELLFVLHPQELAASIHFAPERVRAFAVDELRRFAAAAAPAFADRFDLCVRTGDARDAILEEASGRQADLIVLGTHGRSGIERWLLGSVATGVLRRAATNLLIVPRHEAATRPAGGEGSG